MHVWMSAQVLPPGVEHEQKANRSSEVSGVFRQGEKTLGRGAKQDPIHLSPVLQSQGADLIREREDHVEIRHLEQLLLSVLAAGVNCTLVADENCTLGAL
jgi:hypothetical protein